MTTSLQPASRNGSPSVLGKTAVALISAALALTAACGGSKGTSTPVPRALSITNSTPCIVHLRFDNGTPVRTIDPGVTVEYTDDKLASYSYAQIESTMAIFRTYNMTKVRSDGYKLTVAPTLGDKPCYEKPRG